LILQTASSSFSWGNGRGQRAAGSGRDRLHKLLRVYPVHPGESRDAQRRDPCHVLTDGDAARRA
jgi:hypothetical protein